MLLSEVSGNEIITIGGLDFSVLVHPEAGKIENLAYIQEGREAFILKLKQHNDNHYYALKVFKQKYRTERIRDVSRKLKEYDQVFGLRVADRFCISSDSEPNLIKRYSDAEYAVLMPWIDGYTWFDYLLKKKPFDLHTGIEFVCLIAQILVSMEDREIAHCDISSANVILDEPSMDVNFIDIEGMYSSDLDVPNYLVVGTPGYQHKRSIDNKGHWFKYGDRFAGAVLMAEIICWHDPGVRENRAGEQYFSPKDVHNPYSKRYQIIHSVLNTISIKLADLFERAWTSPSLQACPSLREWLNVIETEEKKAMITVLQKQYDHAARDSRDKQIAEIGKKLMGVGYRFTDRERILYHNARIKLSVNENLSHALKSGQDAELVFAYKESVHAYKEQQLEFQLPTKYNNLIKDASKRMKLIDRLRSAIKENDDYTILECYDPLLFSKDCKQLTKDELLRCELAKQRETALGKFRTLLGSNDPKAIVNALDPGLFTESNLLCESDLLGFMRAQGDLEVKPAQQTSLSSSSLPKESDHYNDNIILDLWMNCKISESDIAGIENKEKFTNAIRQYGYLLQISRAIKNKDIPRLKYLVTRCYYSNLPYEIKGEIKAILSDEEDR